MPVALKPENFDINKLKYAEVKPLKNNPQAKTCGIFYEGDRPTFQTPVMHLPYGINDNSKLIGQKGNEGMPKKYDVSLSFRGKEENPRLNAFFEMLLAIDKKIKDDAFANRLTWFKKDFNGLRDVVDSLYSPSIKFDIDKETGKIQNKYPPTFGVKLPYDASTDTFKFDAMDMAKTELDFKSVLGSLKGGKCQAIVQLGGLWFAGGRFGCTWRVEMAKFDAVNKKSKYTFDSDDEDDAESEDSEDADVAEDAVVAVGNTTKIEDSDEDDDDEDAAEDDEEEVDSDLEEEVAPPPPPPVPEKKKTSKAAAAAAAAAAAVAAVSVLSLIHI